MPCKNGEILNYLYSISMQKPNFEQYKEFQDYTNYIDTSQVMLDFYKQQPGSCLEKYYLMIEEWLSMDVPASENTPLLIEGEPGAGKKALLAKWHDYHKALKGRKKDLMILHFGTTGGNSSNYFYALYRILIKLREELSIDQKVELHDEKLRKYFAYWLDVCNQRIQNQAIKNLDVLYDKVILVFEGIDCFLDRTSGKEGNIAFWLPRTFPSHVKVIVTADSSSCSANYFHNLNSQKITIPYDQMMMKAMLTSHTDKPICLSGSLKTELMILLQENFKNTQITSLYVKTYLNCLLPERIDSIQLEESSLKKIEDTLVKVDKDRLRKCKNSEQLFDYILDFWGSSLFSQPEKFTEVINLLVSTQKGLTKGEIISITKVDQEQLKLFFTIFKPFIMSFNSLWMIKNDSFKLAISKKYDIVDSQINQRIADALKKTPNSIRKLEEQTYQLYSAGNYFKLKEVISDIENFLLLFNPYTKYDLCRYWQRLEERSFDPVIEYNKAIEGFEMHYHPTSDDLFRIITQISRFLREFSDFQTYYTPEFRHPKLIGNQKELEDIGILGEFKNLALCQEEDQDGTQCSEPVYEEQSSEHTQNEEQKRLKKKLKDMYQKIQQGKHIKKPNNIEIDNSNKTKNRPKKQKETRIQQLNVEVKSNENYFRQFYYNQIKGFLQKVSLEKEEEPNHTLDNDRDDQECEESDEEIESNTLVARIKSMEKEKSKPEDFKNLKSLYAKTVVEEFELNQKPPTNYYYKRWIWMQFPWVCMTMKCDYSDKLRKCFTSPTSYMSVGEERQFTLQALKIALEAKKKKQAILQKAQDAPKLKKQTKSSLGNLNTSGTDKFSNRENTVMGWKNDQSMMNKTKKSRKVEEPSFVTHSFLSLHNLSKEIDNINSKQDSKNSLFITAENNADYSSLLHSFQKKKGKNSTVDLQGTKQGLLPRIKQNANKEMTKELEELEKNNQSIRRDLDSYLYKNKILAKRLKELKIIQYNNQSQLKNEKKIEEKKQRIQEIEEKIEKVKYQYAFSLLEHERLNVLIKICRKNKTQNEEAIPELVLECNNFKKMIKIESESIQTLKKKIDEVKKLTKKFVANCYERIENEESLQKQIQQTLRNRENFQNEVSKYDSMIVEELEQKRKELQELHNSSIRAKQESMHDKPKKNYSQEDQYLDAYDQLSKHLDLENESYYDNPQYIRLIDGLEKKRQFETVINERRMHLEQLQKKYEEKKRELDTLSKAKEEGDEEPSVDNLDQEELLMVSDQALQEVEKESNQKKRILQKTTAMKLGCLGMLNTMYSRLGLPEVSKLTITPEFLQKVEEAKVLSKVQSC